MCVYICLFDMNSILDIISIINVNLYSSGSKREEKTKDQPNVVVRADDLYGFLPGQEAALRRTGTLPTRTKTSGSEIKLRKGTPKLTRHRSLLPTEKRNVPIPVDEGLPASPLEIEIPVQSARSPSAEGRSRQLTQSIGASPVKQRQQLQPQQRQQQQHDLVSISIVYGTVIL